MKLNLTINIDGSVVGNVVSDVIPTPVPTPSPVVTPPRSFGGGSIDDQVKVLLQWQFDNPSWPNQILIDGNAYGQPGQPPAARYSTLGGRLALEGALRESAKAASLTDEQLAAVKDTLPTLPPVSRTDATKLWETVPSTLDPASMSFLLAWQGGTNALEAAKQYRTWYYKTYGKQCMLPNAPRNPEAAWISDSELAAIIAS